MLSLIPQHEPETPSQTYAEAVSRLASVRHALRLVDSFGGGPADDFDDDTVAAAWTAAGEAKQHWFDRRSAALVGTTAAGIEALLAERNDRREPHAAASKTLVDDIRRELRDVAGIVLA